MIEISLTLLFVFLGTILIWKDSENFIYISLVESLFPVRFYSVLFGLPIMFLLPALVVAVHYRKIRLPMPDFSICLVMALSIYTFFSYYCFFDSLLFIWLNNFIWLLLIISIVDSERITIIVERCLQIFKIMGICLSLMLFIALMVDDFRLFGNPRQIAFYVVICMAASLTEERFRVRLFSKQMAYLAAMGATVFFSGGRLPLVLMLFIIILGMLLTCKNMRTGLMRISCLGIFLFAVVRTEVFQHFMLRDSDAESLHVSLLEDGGFTSGRSVIYEAAFAQFLDYPVWGMGYQSFKSPVNPYNPFWRPTESLSVHSVFLQYLAEIGLVGTVLYTAILLHLIITGLLMYIKAKKNSWYYSRGIFAILTGIIFIGGGIFDNHGFHYRILFFLILLSFLARKQYKWQSEKKCHMGFRSSVCRQGLTFLHGGHENGN